MELDLCMPFRLGLLIEVIQTATETLLVAVRPEEGIDIIDFLRIARPRKQRSPTKRKRNTKWESSSALSSFIEEESKSSKKRKITTTEKRDVPNVPLSPRGVIGNLEFDAPNMPPSPRVIIGNLALLDVPNAPPSPRGVIGNLELDAPNVPLSPRGVLGNLEVDVPDVAPIPLEVGEPEMPARLRDVIGNMEAVMLLLVKKMTVSDLSKGQSRLLLPKNKLREDEFLREEEKMEASRSEEDGKKLGLGVMVMEPRMVQTEMRLKEWKLGSKQHYVLAGSNWHKIVAANRIKKDHVIQVWFYRDAQENPCFALVNLNRAPPD